MIVYLFIDPFLVMETIVVNAWFGNNEEKVEFETDSVNDDPSALEVLIIQVTLS